LVEAAPGRFLFFDEVELVGANLFGTELFGGPVEVPGKKGDTFDLGLDGFRGVVAQTEVFDVALT
jgi:hypothetical protein